MLPFMKAIARLALILCLMLTSIGLGAARGIVQIDGRIVLCTGEAIVVTQAADGRPAGPAHLCPDMALSLLAAVLSADAASTPPPVPQRLAAGTHDRAVLTFDPPRAIARAPPGLA